MKPSTTSVIQFISKLLVTAVGFIGTVIFARLLGSSILGTYFLIVAVLSWLEFVGQLGIASAIRKRVSERGSSSEFLSAGVLLQSGILFVLVLALFVAQEELNEYIGADVAPILILMLVSKLFFELARVSLQGQHRVATAAFLELGSQIARSAFQILLVILGFELFGLLFGYIAAFTIATIGGIVLIVARHTFTWPSAEHFRQIFEFARYSWLGAVKGRTSSWMDTIVLGFFVTPSLIGIYEVSWNIAMVLVLASQSISNALFPTISELATEEVTNSARGLLEQSLTFAGLIAIPGAVGAILVAPDLLRVYGAEFTQGRIVLSILSIFAILASYETQLQNGLNALDRPDITFRVNAVFITANILLNVGLIYLYGWIGAAVATTISTAVSLGYSSYAIKEIVNLTVPTREFLYQWIAAGIMGITVIFTERLVSAYPYYFVLIPIGAGILVYFVVLGLLSSQIRNKSLAIFHELRANTGRIL